MIDMSFYEFNRQFYEPRDYKQGKKKMETKQTATNVATGFNTEFNGDKIKAAIEAATVTERHQGREREVVEPGDVGAATTEPKTASWDQTGIDKMYLAHPGVDELESTVQTDADINP